MTLTVDLNLKMRDNELKKRKLKLKKIKTKFLRCTGYLNSIKNPIKQDLLQILVLVQQQNFLNC